MNLWEQWKQASEAWRERPRELRRLAREHPEAPAETFFSADELESLELMARRLGRQFKPPKTIMDAVAIAGAMVGLAARKGKLVYLPSIGSLERAFDKLETIATALRDERERDARQALEESRRGHGGEA